MRARIVSQYIRMRWTKRSRGARAATVRNQIPWGVRLPVDVLESDTHTTHALQASEDNGFKIERRENSVNGDGSGTFQIGHLRVELEDAGVRVHFRYTDSEHVRTHRNLDEEVALLTPGRWTRVVWNERFSHLHEGYWWYEQAIVNVAFVDVPEADIFVSGQPVCEYVQLVKLF